MPRPNAFVAAIAAFAFLAPQAGIAAEVLKSGDWLYQSKAVAEVDGETWVSCLASTESPDGTELAFRFERAPDNAVETEVWLENAAWDIDAAARLIRLDIGGGHWVLPANGDHARVAVVSGFDSHLLALLEDLASSRVAVLTTWDGATISRFSLSGSRDAIEAMKRCIEDQIGETLKARFEKASGGSDADPF